jgi:hypothetical protein
MKKILIITILAITTLGCSSDSNSSNNNLFLNINIGGTNYSSEGMFSTGYGGEENCLNNGDLFLQYAGDVENSSFFIECEFVHFENAIDFDNPQKNIISSTRLTDINDLYEANYGEDACSLNNDFSIIYEDKVSNEFLRLIPNSAMNHTITNVVFSSEDATSKFYIIEGTFSATFLKGNTDVPVNGNYRIKIETLK